MEQFIFDDYNYTTINLSILAQYDKEGNKYFYKSMEERRDNGIIQLTFWDDDHDNTNKPSQTQLNTVNFIKNNQQELLYSFYNYTKEVLYPTHISYIGYDEVAFPEITCVDDLRKSLGISNIYIMDECKDDICYVLIQFEFSGDYEHGTVLNLHKTKVIGWAEDLDFAAVFEDMKSVE